MSNKKKLSQMQVFARADSSAAIGSGHLMRCLTLAEELRDRGAQVVFICRDHPGNFSFLVEQKGFALEPLPVVISAGEESNGYESWIGDTWENDAQATLQIIDRCPRGARLLVVDHYGLDHRWETLFRPCVDRILVIDDLADRRHECDFLLDQNLHENMETRYKGLVPENCRLFLGPAYALIRKEFREAKARMKPRDGQVRRILVFMGGADPTNETMKALEAVEMLHRPDIAVDVVVGAKHPFLKEIQKKCLMMRNTAFHCQTDRMAELMAQADLAIGGGGTATWERCYMELPSITLSIAENQKGILESLSKIGGTMYLGYHEDVNREQLTSALSCILEHPDRAITMIQAIREIVSNPEELLINVLLKMP